MAKTNYKTIDEYHKVFPEQVQERMQTIRALIHEVAPKAEEVISYQIPAFKIGKAFLIYYAAFPKHLTLSSPWSEAFLHEFSKDLNGMKVSKSVIQFPHEKPLPIGFVKRLLRFRKKEVEGK